MTCLRRSGVVVTNGSARSVDKVRRWISALRGEARNSFDFVLCYDEADHFLRTKDQIVQYEGAIARLSGNPAKKFWVFSDKSRFPPPALALKVTATPMPVILDVAIRELELVPRKIFMAEPTDNYVGVRAAFPSSCVAISCSNA